MRGSNPLFKFFKINFFGKDWDNFIVLFLDFASVFMKSQHTHKFFGWRKKWKNIYHFVWSSLEQYVYWSLALYQAVRHVMFLKRWVLTVLYLVW